MSKRLIFIASLALGLILFFSSCGGDEEEIPPSIDIPLAFFSPMAQGDYTVKITITAPDISNQIVSEQNLAIVEGANRIYDVRVDNIPIGVKRAVKVEVFKENKRLFEGAGTVNISSGENQLPLRLEKVAELLTSEPVAGSQMLGTGVLTLNFSAPPGTVTVNGAKAVVQGNIASWTAPGLAAGLTNLNVAWTAAGGGNHTLPMVIIGSAAVVAISPDSGTLTAIGETVRLSSTVKDAKDQTVPGATVTWRSSNSAVASVDSSGLVTARGNGTATITATSGGKSASVTITVAQMSSTIAITPVSATLVAIGETLQLSPTVKDTKDQTITSATITWQSSNPSVADVSASGLVTARGNGTATITATSGEKSASVTITVSQASSTVVITPVSSTLVAISETVQLRATVRDGNNNIFSDASISWSSSNPSVATVNTQGLVTARGSGSTIITATAGDRTATAAITVVQLPNTVVITPASATLFAIGETVQLHATVKDEKAQTVPGATVTWQSNNTTVANVNSSGLVTAHQNGTTTITVTSGGKSASVTITVAQVSSTITITPAAATLTALGETAQLRVTVKDAKNQTVPGATVTWQSSNTAIVSVNSSGLVTALANGTATITAASGGKFTTVTITVLQAPTTIAITPASATLRAIGQTTQLTATVQDTNNNPVTGATVAWKSSNTTVASVNSSGLVNARGNGTAIITGISGGKTATAIITVAQETATIGITPAAATLKAIGQTLQLTATVQDTNNNPITGATVTWKSNNPTVVSVNSSGLVNALTNGQATVTVTSGGKSATATIIVAQASTTIAISPISVNLTALGDTVQLTATVRDANNNPLPGASVSWSSGSPSVATVNTQGLVTARGSGTTTITATSGSRTGTAAITVVQLPNTIVITPASATLFAIGETVQLHATVKDEKAQTVPGATVTWQSSNTAVASVNPSGLVTARGSGTATITATSGGKTATATITVARPDLIVQSPSATPNSVSTRRTFTLWTTVRNQGAGTADATTLRYYRSTDAIISTSDILVGTDSVSSIAAAHTSDHSINLTAPSSAGTYYYGACVVAVNGENFIENNCSQGVEVIVTPDRTIEPVTIISSSPIAGGQMPQGGSITIIFSNLPGNVTVNSTQAVVQGATAIWTDTGLPVGMAILDVVWTAAGGGRSIIELTITAVLSGIATEGKIAFVSNRDGDREIYVMDSDGMNQINLTNNPVWDEQPAWSPDGRRIAFASNRDGNSEIYVMDTNGRNQTNLTNNPAWDEQPAWSPDGRRIAFASNRDGNSEIYVMDTNGRNQTNLTNNSNKDWDPAWSPDGSKIAFVSNRDTDWEIYVMDTNGRNQTNLTNNSNTDTQPSWAPDGSKLALNRDAGGLIYVIDADGANPNRLSDNPRGDYNPAWSPDGRKIAFMSNRDGNSEIYVMDADGRNQINLTNNPSEDYEPAWSRRH